jgi:hypothetical protein
MSVINLKVREEDDPLLSNRTTSKGYSHFESGLELALSASPCEHTALNALLE